MASAPPPIVGPFYDAHLNGFRYHARDLGSVFLGDAKAVAERAVGQATVIVHIAENGMLVAASHTLLPRELAKGLAPENDHLSAVVVGAKIRRGSAPPRSCRLPCRFRYLVLRIRRSDA